jgi:hypothetical protein
MHSNGRWKNGGTPQASKEAGLDEGRQMKLPAVPLRNDPASMPTLFQLFPCRRTCHVVRATFNIPGTDMNQNR